MSYLLLFLDVSIAGPERNSYEKGIVKDMEPSLSLLQDNI